MSEAYIGELRIFSFGFAPRGWALCNGQILPINQNQALFSILGTTYGGNGTTNFALPNLQGRTPIHWGSGPGLPVVNLGQIGGEETHTLTIAEIPSHIHTISGSSNNPSATSPSGAFLSTFTADDVYTSGGNSSGTMNPTTIVNAGGSQPHNNLQPYSVVSICIALVGIFPSRS